MPRHVCPRAHLNFFFFQAEDGIRDDLVTGVQTCALPISEWPDNLGRSGWWLDSAQHDSQLDRPPALLLLLLLRSALFAHSSCQASPRAGAHLSIPLYRATMELANDHLHPKELEYLLTHKSSAPDR